MINQTTVYGSTVTYFLGLLRNNLTDVSSPTGVGSLSGARNDTSDWVVASFPQPKKYGNFPGYPLVIVNTPSISATSNGLRNVKLDSAELVIQVLDKGTSPVNSDNVMSQIKQCIQSHWTSTRAEGIAMMTLDSTQNNVMDSGDDTIIKSLSYSLTYSNMPGYVSPDG